MIRYLRDPDVSLGIQLKLSTLDLRVVWVSDFSRPCHSNHGAQAPLLSKLLGNSSSLLDTWRCVGSVTLRCFTYFSMMYMYILHDSS